MLALYDHLYPCLIPSLSPPPPTSSAGTASQRRQHPHKTILHSEDIKQEVTSQNTYRPQKTNKQRIHRSRKEGEQAETKVGEREIGEQIIYFVILSNDYSTFVPPYK